MSDSKVQFLMSNFAVCNIQRQFEAFVLLICQQTNLLHLSPALDLLWKSNQNEPLGDPGQQFWVKSIYFILKFYFIIILCSK